jgi:HK97 gp10 family phage protein
MPPSISITGIDEVLALLDEVPKNIVLLGYSRAARAAMNVVGAALAERTPIGTGETAGDLVKAMRIEVTVDSSARGVSASVGFGGIQGPIANDIEYGHEQVTHLPEHRVVGHIPPQPFMRPAFDASTDAAVEAFVESLESTLKETY